MIEKPSRNPIGLSASLTKRNQSIPATIPSLKRLRRTTAPCFAPFSLERKERPQLSQNAQFARPNSRPAPNAAVKCNAFLLSSRAILPPSQQAKEVIKSTQKTANEADHGKPRGGPPFLVEPVAEKPSSHHRKGELKADGAVDAEREPKRVFFHKCANPFWTVCSVSEISCCEWESETKADSNWLGGKKTPFCKQA